ncbi:hypothetical protein HK104_003997 [Borealophlyctis nickersoniae]|nr:hypothetical protein HK104_003997 [Borealophlyctis nickersoniae]
MSTRNNRPPPQQPHPSLSVDTRVDINESTPLLLNPPPLFRSDSRSRIKSGGPHIPTFRKNPLTWPRRRTRSDGSRVVQYAHGGPAFESDEDVDLPPVFLETPAAPVHLVSSRKSASREGSGDSSFGVGQGDDQRGSKESLGVAVQGVESPRRGLANPLSHRRLSRLFENESDSEADSGSSSSSASSHWSGLEEEGLDSSTFSLRVGDADWDTTDSDSDESISYGDLKGADWLLRRSGLNLAADAAKASSDDLTGGVGQASWQDQETEDVADEKPRAGHDAVEGKDATRGKSEDYMDFTVLEEARRVKLDQGVPVTPLRHMGNTWDYAMDRRAEYLSMLPPQCIFYSATAGVVKAERFEDFAGPDGHWLQDRAEEGTFWIDFHKPSYEDLIMIAKVRTPALDVLRAIWR